MSLLTQPVVFKNFAETFDWTINDQASLRSNWADAPYYYIHLESADGFFGSDVSTESHPIPHGIGERSGDSFRRGKGITLSGSIEGRNVADLQIAALYLQQMFWDTQPRKLVWTGLDGTPAYYTCRVLNDISITEDYSQLNPKWQWTVGLRADDPRAYVLSDDSLYYTWMT
jgi:hypothetical protein